MIPQHPLEAARSPIDIKHKNPPNGLHGLRFGTRARRPSRAARLEELEAMIAEAKKQARNRDEEGRSK
jgi:hypothetical protein